MTENLVFSGNYCNLKGLYPISDLTKKGSSLMTTASIAITNKLTTNINYQTRVRLLLPVLDFTSNLNLHLIRIV